MTRPYFSIILPTYNRAEFIENTINTVLEQTFEDFELLVIDDGSTDNTKDVIAKYNDKRIKYFFKENEERNFARNYGIEKATGKFIGFLDSDDYFLKFHLRYAFECITKHSNYKWFYFNAGFLNNDKVIAFKPRDKNLRNELIKENVLSINGVVIKSEVAKEIKFLPSKDAILSEDHCLWIKLGARYDLYHGTKITNIINNHDLRGLYNINLEKLIQGTTEIINELKSDEEVNRYYGRKCSLLYAQMLTQIARIAYERSEFELSKRFLGNAIKEDLKILFKKSFIATVKNVLGQPNKVT